jgi:hypothetical protein
MPFSERSRTQFVPANVEAAPDTSIASRDIVKIQDAVGILATADPPHLTVRQQFRKRSGYWTQEVFTRLKIPLPHQGTLAPLP